jgi:RNA polymerase sigma-70 factor (ECF subfamily)
MVVLRAELMPSTRSHSLDPEGGLLVRSRNGDREAFGELVLAHQRRVWLICRQYLGADEADAATQDTFIKAYTSLSSFDGRSAFTTWLTRIAINTCLDELRRRKREGLRIETEPDEAGTDALTRLPDDAAGPEDRAMQRQAVATLRACEKRLPERQREIFRLRFYSELELDDIAAALGVHVGTIKTQLHRAVHRLRKELGELR